MIAFFDTSIHIPLLSGTLLLDTVLQKIEKENYPLSLATGALANRAVLNVAEPPASCETNDGGTQQWPA